MVGARSRYEGRGDGPTKTGLFLGYENGDVRGSRRESDVEEAVRMRDAGSGRHGM